MTFLLDNDLQQKISALDPNFKEKINDLFTNINKSISMLYDAAIRDEKTGLYNHKFFETILEMEIDKAKRKKEKLSIMITDIDFFKKINDTYGHLKADELLAQLARVITKTIRKSDVPSRFGGEEFFILLPETSLDKAKKLAARLKKAIHEDKMLKKHGLTVSGGITEFRLKDNQRRFKERADRALYKAKHGGRDKFVAEK